MSVRQVRLHGPLPPAANLGLQVVAHQGPESPLFVELRDTNGRRVFWGRASLVHLDMEHGPMLRIDVDVVLSVPEEERDAKPESKRRREEKSPRAEARERVLERYRQVRTLADAGHSVPWIAKHLGYRERKVELILRMAGS